MQQGAHATQRRHLGSPALVPGIHSEPIAALQPFASLANCGRHQEICSETSSNEYLHYVVSGAAGRYSSMPDGRRQMIDLLLPGDFYGYTSQPHHEFTLEAIVEGTLVARYPRRRVEALAATDPKLANELREIAFATISRTEALLMILGRVTALEKVGAFLIEMAARLRNGQRDDVLLPVSRGDIADILAISAETVSRALSDLKCRGVIRFMGTRQVRIVNRDALEGGCSPSGGCELHRSARVFPVAPQGEDRV